jgi:hypothetical protein
MGFNYKNISCGNFVRFILNKCLVGKLKIERMKTSWELILRSVWWILIEFNPKKLRGIYS